MRWSNASLTCHASCGEQYRRRYLEKERVPRTPRQISGIAPHAAAAESFRRKMATGTLPTVEEAQDASATAFEAAWSEGIWLSPEDREKPLATLRGDAKDFAVDVGGYHVEVVAPRIDPIAVEERITIMPETCDGDELVGVLDVVQRTASEAEYVRDLKTSEKAPGSDEAANSMQLTIYAMLWLEGGYAAPTIGDPDGDGPRVCSGHAPLVALDYLVRTPSTKKKSYTPQESMRGPAEFQALEDRINLASRSVQAGVFLPAPPGAWWCSANWCEFWKSCPWGSGGRGKPRT